MLQFWVPRRHHISTANWLHQHRVLLQNKRTYTHRVIKHLKHKPANILVFHCMNESTTSHRSVPNILPVFTGVVISVVKVQPSNKSCTNFP
jgi:hypothetical protein